MPSIFNAESPGSSLSPSSFEGSLSSASSALSFHPTSPVAEKVSSSFQLFESLFLYQTSFNAPLLYDIKSGPTPFFNSFESIDMSCSPYLKQESIHQSIQVPATPPLDPVSSLQLDTPFDRSMLPPLSHPFPSSLSNLAPTYTPSPPDNATPLPSPLPKKPARVTKQDRGIKCDHCGVDKTPLWRKVPNKDNAYHWYTPRPSQLM
jgi:hypothetical protein